jgi:hypothetical protein
MGAKTRKSRPVSRPMPDATPPSGRRRDKDVSNSHRLLATVEGESGYLGRVRGANGGRWKVI